MSSHNPINRTEVVDKLPPQLSKGRKHHEDLFKEWFETVFGLKDGKWLKIILEAHKTADLPSSAGIVYVVKRHNLENPTRQIEIALRDSRTDHPTVYLRPQLEEVSKDSKKSKPVSKS